MVLSYEQVFNRVRNKITDPKELSLEERYLNEIYAERLHSVIGNQRVRRLFSSITLDDDSEEIDFTLNHSVDEFSDEEFVTEVFVLGIVIEWLQPKVDSILFTAPMIGGKEENKVLDHHKDTIDRLGSLKNELNKKIRDYGYMYNSYIGGE